MQVNFDNVQEVQNNNTTSTFKIVKKGAQKLTITAIEDIASLSGTPGLKVTFNSEKYDADFTHNFYITEKAMAKIADLIEGFTGTKPTGNIDTDTLPALLVGKTANAIVDDQAYSKEKDGKVYTNYAPTLRFRDFASQTKEYKDEDARTEDRTAPKAVAASVASDSKKEDDSLPF